MKIVLVDWIDSCSGTGWKDLSEIKNKAARKNNMSCKTVGFVLVQNSSYILLGMSSLAKMPKEEQQFTETIQIPMKAVESITELIISE